MTGDDREAKFRADREAKLREMSMGRLLRAASPEGRQTHTDAAYAQAEIWRRESEERNRIATRQQWTAWASVAAAGLAALAAVVLAVIAWVQTFGGIE
jgi:hypothetical protein